MLWAADHPCASAEWDVTFDELRTYVNLGERILRTPPERRTVRHEKALTDFFVREYGRVLSKEEYAELGYADLAKQLRALDEALPPFGEAQAVRVAGRPPQTHVFLGGSYKPPAFQSMREYLRGSGPPWRATRSPASIWRAGSSLWRTR